MSTRDHWEKIYRERAPERVSWYQPDPLQSIALIENAGLGLDDPVIDIGGGASLLVDRLLNKGYRKVIVLDISSTALALAQKRLGLAAKKVAWLAANATRFRLEERVRLWHDRAVFHFLTDAGDRAAYREQLENSLEPGGQVIIATFAPGGPLQCSGLDIVQYDAAAIQEVLGERFRLLETVEEIHQTPTGAIQPFNYFRFTFQG